MRLIDGDALMEKFAERVRRSNESDFAKSPTWNDAVSLVECEPTAGGWIPVSERLPDDMTYVLTTIHIPGRESVVRSGFYENGLFHNDNGDVWKATDIEVLAWLPLPEPYEEGE